jgi:hypothetical protein
LLEFKGDFRLLTKSEMVMLGPPEKIDKISSDLASKKSQKAFGRAVLV